ncbi:MAG: DUF3087 family protein [Gammaproteobacteria bacterium]|nr:DUF3087 family protein [Gammaproteobacteria bacterium]
MQLRSIDKARYQRHLRIVFAGIVAVMVIVTLAASTAFIRFFSSPEASHFMHNLAGVAVAAGVAVYILTRLRKQPFLQEVVYIWDLKQQLNRIYRKQRKVEAALEANDVDAMQIMNFQYQGSLQLYAMDDNTITIDDLQLKFQALKSRMQKAGLDASRIQYEAELLDRF